MLQIAVLVSGSGTNLQAIIDKIENGELKCKISLVISTKKDIFALTRAKNHNIPIETIEFNQDFEKKLMKLLQKNEIDLIVLAGFLKILGKEIVEKYRSKIVNIHPSIIPSFCGNGYYGIKIHKEVIKAGVKITGATVHFVDENTDTGPIILQKAVEVLEDDTPESLQKRVMAQAEQIILPQAIKLICEDKITIENNKVKIRRQ